MHDLVNKNLTIDLYPITMVVVLLLPLCMRVIMVPCILYFAGAKDSVLEALSL